MAEMHSNTVTLHVQRPGQLLQPLPILRAGPGQRVVVTDLGKQVVSRIGVATLTIGQFVADAVVVVALETDHTGVSQHGDDPIRVRPEGAHVTQAIQFLGVAPLRIEDGGFQGQVIAVQATKKCQFHVPHPPAPPSITSNVWPDGLVQIAPNW